MSSINKKIYINQAGYLPKDIKTAVLPVNVMSVSVIDKDDKEVYRAKCDHFGFDKPSGDDVYHADFSEVTTEGEYRLVSGDYYSDKFCIGDSAYDKVFYDLVRAYYYFRCGMELKSEHAGKFTHMPCHTEPACEWFDHSVTKDVSGGWHDAGDYGRYVTAGAVALGHLLYAFVLFPKTFEKRDFGIPKTPGLPDFLTECKYELDWLLKMQKPDGGVYHKASTAQHADFVMPEDDLGQMYLLPVSSMAVADFAAVCALAYRVYAEYDKEYADRLLQAAKRSAEWLDNNQDFIGFRNPEGCGTGDYCESNDKDNRFWAYSELYASTGDCEYLNRAEKLSDYGFSKTDLGWGAVGGLGALAYITLRAEWRDESKAKEYGDMYISSAESLLQTANQSGYMAAMGERSYSWGSNMTLMKNAMIFAIADIISPNKEFSHSAKAQFDVLMGVNAMGISYVTGNGDSAYNYPHLRPAFADRIKECIPGMVSGGPNSYRNELYIRQFIPEGTPPMKCFADRTELYSVNEVTIYWNSPAVFVTAYLLDGKDGMR